MEGGLQLPVGELSEAVSTMLGDEQLLDVLYALCRGMVQNEEEK